MGDDHESISSEEDDSEEESSEEEDYDMSESRGSRSRKGSRLEESVGKASLSRSRDDREPRKRSSSKKKVKAFKWVEPVRPEELTKCKEIDRRQIDHI